MNEQTVNQGDEFVERDPRLGDRTLKVLHVVNATPPTVRRGAAVCSTRGGKLTLVSLDRLSNPVRFSRREKIEGEVAA